MAVNKEALMRFKIIDECIRNKHHKYPDMDWLLWKCEEKLGTEFSVSCIQKDIKAMKEDPILNYRAPIAYSRKYQGYYYTDPKFSISYFSLDEIDLNALEFAANVLQQFSEVSMFKSFGFAVEKIFNAINITAAVGEDDVEQMVQFEEVRSASSSEYLEEFIEAIKLRRKVTFQYKKHTDNKAKSYSVHPYLLKEYRSVWYLFSYNAKRDMWQTFGLDRISVLKTSKDTFRRKYGFKPNRFFSETYGITSFKGEPEDIVLSFKPLQGKYVKNKPLHKSQHVLLDNEEEFRVCLTVGVTYELVQDLIGFGANVKVIEPQHLQQTIKRQHQKALAVYD